MIRRIGGGVCAAKGFKAGAVFCGVKPNSPPDSKEDLMMIASDYPCTAAGVFTKNSVKAAPVQFSQMNIADGFARVIVANSGNANCACAHDMENAIAMADAAAHAVGVPKEQVLVASTGVIGQELRIKQIVEGIPRVAAVMDDDESTSDAAARAIRTTDTFTKTIAVENEIDGVTFHLGGIAKGSGMIHPNMGTMLCFITTDLNISHEMLEKGLRFVNNRSFSRITVDGDTSTNDSFIVMANGACGNRPIVSDEGPGSNYEKFLAALNYVAVALSRFIASDGEGATKLLKCIVVGAESEEAGSRMARAIVGSNLVKTAMFGCDANWGRILCAMGYSGVPFDINNVRIRFHSIGGHFDAMVDGKPVPFDEEHARNVLSQKEIHINVTLDYWRRFVGYAYGCDMSYDYVKINGDYRT